jgi:FkbM family methyltransferase
VGAVWIEDGEITYEFEKGQEYAARLHETGTHGTGGRRAPSFSLNTLTAGDLVIDLLKMDIEGAEQAVLRRNTEWAERVRAIKVATHPPYSLEECAEDLRALGFETRLDYGNWGSSVIGVRL